MRSGHENLTDGQMDGRHDIIRPVFDGCIKRNADMANIQHTKNVNALTN